jgi:hypothetical protein
MDKADIYRTAKILTDRYGADAPTHAAMKANAMLERGDLNGAGMWKQVLRAIMHMRASEGRAKH